MSLTDKIVLASRMNILSDILDILDIRAGRQLQGEVLGAVEGSLDEGDVVVVSVHAAVRGPRQHELPGGGWPARGARQEEGVRSLPVIREPLQRGWICIYFSSYIKLISILRFMIDDIAPLYPALQLSCHKFIQYFCLRSRPVSPNVVSPSVH